MSKKMDAKKPQNPTTPPGKTITPYTIKPYNTLLCHSRERGTRGEAKSRDSESIFLHPRPRPPFILSGLPASPLLYKRFCDIMHTSWVVSVHKTLPVPQLGKKWP
jgi:hypothetical protein